MLKDKGGTEFILQDPGMKKMFVPVITADCKLEENYRFDASAGPLKCPLLVFYGKKEGHDKMKTVIDAEAVEAWMELTACPKLSKLQALESDWHLGTREELLLFCFRGSAIFGGGGGGGGAGQD